MTDIEQALVELEASDRHWRSMSMQDTQEKIDASIDRRDNAVRALIALRAKEARENALYAPQWTLASNPPGPAVTLDYLRTTHLDWIIALHPFDKAEGKYTGEVIRGEELVNLLAGQTPFIGFADCGCLTNRDDAHRVGCPRYPEGKKG